MTWLLIGLAVGFVWCVIFGTPRGGYRRPDPDDYS